MASTVQSAETPQLDEAVAAAIAGTQVAQDEPTYLQEAWEEDDTERSFSWVAPTLAIVATIAWFAGMGWLLRDSLSPALSAPQIVQLIAALCVPPALIGILYLLAMRNSAAEARRFGNSARAMRAEAASLERVVGTLSRRLEENRAELARQTTTLMAMGEAATDRMGGLANDMSQQSRIVDAATRTLHEAVDEAEKSVAIVLSSLPKASAEMQGMATRVESAGLMASERAAALDTQLTALAERGRDADAVAGGAADRLAAHIARMEATSESAGVRLEQVTGDMSVAVDGVLNRAARAVDEARKGISAQGEAMLAMLEANQAALDRTGRDSADALAQRIATIEDAIERISVRLHEERGRADLLFDTLVNGTERSDRELSQLHDTGMERTQALAAQVTMLGDAFEAASVSIQAGDAVARAVIATSEDLLVALDASAREIDETLPAALERLDARIRQTRDAVAESKPELMALVAAAENTHDAIEAIADVVRHQRDTLARTQVSLLETLTDGRERADALESIVDDTVSTARRFAAEAAPQLIETLLRVRETSAQAADHARATLASIVPEAEAALEQAGEAALHRAVNGSIRHQLSELADTTEAAVNATTRASERLTQQMLALAETTAQIDRQIERARTEHEKKDGDNFARRVSLLIEALNSASIDITKRFATEVSDSAWAAYLKGDRGVFTRRAVRILDGGETREVVRLYGEDPEFRDNVNRYIHDFEAMLRQILALRDGSSMGVTLLSSDMGKLYVALAQAIERLRG
ncbi:hypothetical protein TPR58_07545 [Sphingomonas sp. HF-S3]|uniref:ATPase n=1 Tax=Sphingomonas rustica TaxID=3103142 RepID=A0ABV0B7Y8_9SPHN